MILFGHFHIGRLKDRPATKEDLLHMEERIMAKQSEVTLDVKALGDNLAAATVKLSDLTTKVNKIGTETDGLKETIGRLEDALNNQDNASQELVDAVAAAKDKVTSLQAAVDAASGAAQTVDDKVADAGTT